LLKQDEAADRDADEVELAQDESDVAQVVVMAAAPEEVHAAKAEVTEVALKVACPMATAEKRATRTVAAFILMLWGGRC